LFIETREKKMRVFLASVFAMIILGAGALLAFGMAQRTSAEAYVTDGVRTTPAWSWRQMLRRSVNQASVGQKVNVGAGINPASMRLEQDDAHGEKDACDQARALRWLMIDFQDGDEGAECHS
jgi:hypothetical protein